MSSLSARPVLRGTALAPAPQPARARAVSRVTVAGNDQTDGPFAPLVVVVRDIVGVKPFNQFRGKAISLHSQVCGHADSLAGGGLRGWEYPGAQRP